MELYGIILNNIVCHGGMLCDITYMMLVMTLGLVFYDVTIQNGMSQYAAYKVVMCDVGWYSMIFVVWHDMVHCTTICLV